MLKTRILDQGIITVLLQIKLYTPRQALQIHILILNKNRIEIWIIIQAPILKSNILYRTFILKLPPDKAYKYLVVGTKSLISDC